MNDKFEKMRIVGGHVANCLRGVGRIIRPGITTKDIENYVRGYVADNDLKNSQHGYRGFPGHCCTSVNEVICHGIPYEKTVLKNGDIIKVDVTLNKNGWHGDACRTFYVGTPDHSKHSLAIQDLIEVTHAAMILGIDMARPGNRISDISKAIEKYVHANGMSVVEEYTGHGIGRVMHESPQIPHYYDPKFPDVELKPGMTFTIEPMVNLGKKEHFIFEDKWAIMTKDGSESAQFEETIGITDDKAEIFTQ